MQINRKFFTLFIIIIVAVMLNACVFGVSTPVSDVQPDLEPIQSIETSVVQTVESMSSLVPTSTSTPRVTVMPTATVTLFHNPTVTAVPDWSACPGIVVTQTDTRKGDMLNIRRCEDGMEYDLGPLAKGIFAISPNNRFLVYVANSGAIYAARIGDTRLNYIFDLEGEHIFTVFNKRVAPDFKMYFAGQEPFYVLVLIEKKYDQKRVYNIPIWIMQ